MGVLEDAGGLSALHYTAMALFLRARSLFRPPEKAIREAGTKPGDVVLDYGCGPGIYLLAAAEAVGEHGIVYAADIAPPAIRGIERLMSGRGLRSVRTILTACPTGLGESTVDLVLLYDTLHDLQIPDDVLRELHRVLKPDGRLSFSDHHMNDGDILDVFGRTGLFEFLERGDETWTFAKKRP